MSNNFQPTAGSDSDSPSSFLNEEDFLTPEQRVSIIADVMSDIALRLSNKTMIQEAITPVPMSQDILTQETLTQESPPAEDQERGMETI